MPPAASLDTGNGDGDGCICRDEDGKVQNSVLHSADDFLTVNQQCGLVTGIIEAKLWNMSGFRDFFDFYTGTRHCLVQG